MKFLSAIPMATLLLGAIPATACTLCQSDTATKVRAIVFGERFGPNLLVTALPFMVFGGIAGLVYRSKPSSRGKHRVV